MSDDTMMSTNPLFFKRVSLLKEQIRKISKAMNSIMIAIGANEYVLNQSEYLLSIIN